MPQGLRYDMRLIPSIQSRLALKYGYQGRIPNLEDVEVLDEDILYILHIILMNPAIMVWKMSFVYIVRLALGEKQTHGTRILNKRNLFARKTWRITSTHGLISIWQKRDIG